MSSLRAPILAATASIVLGMGARGTVIERGLPRLISGNSRCAQSPSVLKLDADSLAFHGPFVPSIGDSARQYSRSQISVATDGTIYVSYRVLDAPEAEQALLLQASRDGAYTWERLGVVEDTIGRVVADPVSARAAQAGGVAWTLIDSTFDWQMRFSRFAQEGLELAQSVRIDEDLPDNAQRDVARLAVTPHALICAWTHRQSNWRGGAATRSFDGGRTWERRTEIIDSTATAIPWGGPFLARAHDDAVYASIFNRDSELRVYRTAPTDTSWILQGTVDHPEIDLTGGISVSSISVSPEGALGVAFEAEAAGIPNPRAEVRFCTSTDDGHTWSAPLEVSAPAGEDRNHGEPKLVADRFGTWHLAWITNALPNILLVDILYSYLAPGDTAWSAPVRVNPDPGMVNAQAPFSLGLAVDEDGFVYITWGHQINSTAIYVATTRPRPYDPYENVLWTYLPIGPNPFRSTTTVVVPMEHAGAATVRLADVTGRLVRTWVLGDLARGTHPLTWDGRNERGLRVSSGVYFWHVERRDAAGVSTLRGRSVRIGQ